MQFRGKEHPWAIWLHREGCLLLCHITDRPPERRVVPASAVTVSCCFQGFIVILGQSLNQAFAEEEGECHQLPPPDCTWSRRVPWSLGGQVAVTTTDTSKKQGLPNQSDAGGSGVHPTHPQGLALCLPRGTLHGPPADRLPLPSVGGRRVDRDFPSPVALLRHTRQRKTVRGPRMNGCPSQPPSHSQVLFHFPRRPSRTWVSGF